MNPADLTREIARGEDSSRQFKADVRNGESLASEMAAFANSNGGTIFIGVADDGARPGLSPQDVARINQLISLGHLPNNLTVEKIRTGNSNIRNPILVSYVPKGLLPYHGLGSGIKRALEAWPQIDFVDDHDGCLFTATVHRKPVEQLELAGPELKTPVKTPDLVLQLLKERPDMTLAEVAETIGKSLSAVERASVKLVKAGHLNMSALAKEDTGRLSSENPGYRNHQQQSSAGAQCVRLLQR